MSKEEDMDNKDKTDIADNVDIADNAKKADKADDVEYSTENMTRLTPLMIYKLLKEESSEDHPLTTGYILSRLEEQGLKITRQTMYKDIALLKQMDFEVMSVRSRSNEYYLVQEEFNIAEQRILMDAVQSAHFIPEAQTRNLCYKVAALNGQAEAPNLVRSIMKGGNVKYEDSKIYYAICNIATAISQDRKIAFYYFDYNEKHQKKYRKNKDVYVENPVGTVCSGNNYYLVVYNEKHDSIINYRVDRMDNVEVYDAARNMPENVEERAQEYLNSQFSMYAGEKETVHFEASEKLVNPILDMFGNEARFLPAPSERVRFRAKVQLSPAFYSWVAGFGGEMKIVYPPAVATNFCNFLKDNLRQYPTRISSVDWGSEARIVELNEDKVLFCETKSLNSERPRRYRSPRDDMTDEEYKAYREARREQLRQRREAMEAEDGIPRRGPGRPRKAMPAEPQDTAPAQSAEPENAAEPSAPANPDEDKTE